MKKQKNTFAAFKKEANEYLKKHYGCTFEEIMVADEDLQRGFDGGETPKEYVDWFADKYGLTKTEDFMADMAVAVMKSIG